MFKKILSLSLINYFRFFARLQLQKNPKATIIAVTGSSGKTSTRLAIVHILKTRGVVKSSIHANSQSGISLNILGLKPKDYSLFDWLHLIILAPYQYLTFREHFDYYVVEMGVGGPDTPNNMAYLLSIVSPVVGVVLNAGLSHAFAFDYLVKDTNQNRRKGKLINLIAKEKMQLVKNMGSHAVAVVNIDQWELLHQTSDIRARLITFGKSKKADFQILGNYIYLYQGNKYQLKPQCIYPESYEYTFAAAICVCAGLGIPPSISLPLLSNYNSPSGRMRIFRGINQSTIIDSSYNASPSSMKENLTNLKRIAGRKKKIAVIGDMRELGNSTKSIHKELATWIMSCADETILFGDYVRQFTLPLLVSQKFKVRHFATMKSLIHSLKSTAKPHTHFLVKGSQNHIFLERAVEALLMNKDEVKQLCRRGPFWDKMRAKTP
ncbi:MAG: Mur ligase family protein [Microgenomates group bacterium]